MNVPLTEDSVLVVIPAYNAARHLPELLSRVTAYVCRSNLLVIDDGSTDETQNILGDHDIQYLRYEHNQGKGAALRAAYDYAISRGYRAVLSLDADLQHPPEKLPHFFACDDGHTVLLGTRDISPRHMPPQRVLSNFLTSLIISSFSNRRVRDSQCGYRLVPTALLKQLDLETGAFDLESELLFKAGALGWPIREVPVDTTYHDNGHSNIRHLGDTLRFIRQTWRRIWL